MKTISTNPLILAALILCIAIYSCNNQKDKKPIQEEITKTSDSISKESATLQISGRLRIQEDSVDNSLIQVIDLADNTMFAELTNTERFHFNLDYKKEYIIEFSEANHTTKKILVNTNVPDSVDLNFPPLTFIVNLFKSNPNTEKEENKPVGRIFYNPKINNFDTEIFFD